jgi:ElaB/YqjD/DUF883 family membrane-anchored ribosome-binding protein
MDDPRRLRDSLAPRAFERLLLDSALGPGPTNAQCDALWVAVEQGIVSASGGVDGSGPGASSGSSGAVAAGAGGKTAAGGALVHGVTLLGVAGVAAAVIAFARGGTSPSVPREFAPRAPISRLVSSAAPTGTASDPQPSREASAAKVAVPTPPRSWPPVAVPRAVVSVVASPAAASTRAATAVSDDVESPLRAESGALLRAHDALVSRDCARALDLLDEVRQRFPKGVLAQEREAFGVQALACAGRSAEAAERAAAFLREYPTSLHASVVRRFAR